ncbi:MAG: hypothetical protein KatS3mg102_1956 [Planctomycetota bacterium]|nr:MAG: hypothetical protein KatS3mg102_1956 [Planctomycetota bacterium]
MAVPLAEPEEIVILRPEAVGEGTGGEDTHKLQLGEGAIAITFAVELADDNDIGPLTRAAETLVHQGKHHIVLDLSRCEQLEPDVVRGLVEAHRACERAGGQLVLAGAGQQVRAALEALEPEVELQHADDLDGALELLRGRIEQRQRALPALSLDVHEVTLGAQRPETGFVEGYRRLGPEGVTRECVVLVPDADGIVKVRPTLQQLVGKNLKAFVIDLGGLEQLDEKQAADLRAACATARRRGGYAVLARVPAAAREWLAAGADAPPSFASREQALEAVRRWVAGQVERSAPAAAGAARASAAPAAPAAGSAAGTAVGTAFGEYVLAEAQGEELVFYRRGDKPGKRAMAATSTLLTIAPAPEGVSGLAAEVARQLARGATRLLVDLSGLPAPSPEELDAILQAQRAAGGGKGRVLFYGLSEAARRQLETLGLADQLQAYPGLLQAAAAVAEQICESKRKRGVRLRCRRVELDASAARLALAEQRAAPQAAGAEEGEGRTRTDKLAGMPEFAESGPALGPTGTDKLDAIDFSEAGAVEAIAPAARQRRAGGARAGQAQGGELAPRPPAAAEGRLSETDRMGKPDFSEEPEAGTVRLQGPPFGPEDEEEDEERAGAARRATAAFGVPDFAEDEEEQEEAPRKTAEFAVPDFLAEEEGEGEQAEPAARPATVQFGVPDFAEDEEEQEEAPRKTAEFAVPDFLAEEEGEGEQAEPAARPATVQFGVPDFAEDEEEQEEAPRKTAEFAVPDFLAEEEGEGEQAEPAARPATVQLGVPDFAEDEEEQEEAPHKTAEFAVPDFLAEEEGEGEQAEPAARPATMQFGVPDFAEQEREEQAEFAAPLLATGVSSAEGTGEQPLAPQAAVEEQEPAELAGRGAPLAHAATEPARPVMAGLEEEGTEPPQPGKPEAEPLRTAKTEVMPGLSREQATELVASEMGAESTGRLQAAATEAMRTAVPADAVTDAERPAAAAETTLPPQLAGTHRDGRTVAIGGMSREQALAEVAAGTESGSHDGRTVAIGSMSREEARRQAALEHRRAAAAAQPQGGSWLKFAGLAAVVVVAAYLGWRALSSPPAQPGAEGPAAPGAVAQGPAPVASRGGEAVSQPRPGAAAATRAVEPQPAAPGAAVPAAARAKLRAAIEDLLAGE